MVILDKKPDGTCYVRGYRSQWLKQAPGLNHDQGVAELTAALAPIVEAENLAGGSVYIALSSDFCVTRVIAGETDKMIAELRDLRDRSAHYLSLGAGAKEVSQAIRSLDVKNSQAFLTVTNQKTLENLVRALEDAGLFPAFIEHSMMAVCRAVGRMGGDSTAPAIIIEPNDRGVDLGISHRGQLLLDYRPGGVCSRETIVNIVEEHLERMQRYCSRFFRFASGQLTRVYLVGNPEYLDQVRVQFMNSRKLTAEIVNPTSACAEWNFAETLVANPFYVAPMGTALVETDRLTMPPDERGFPDLMDAVRRGQRLPLLPLVQKHLWPVAAAGLLGVLVYSGALIRHAQAGSVEGKLATIEAESGAATTMRLEMDHLTIRAKYLKLLDNDLAALPVDALVAQISSKQVRPENLVFLDEINIAQDGAITIKGKSATDEALFEFEKNLKKLTALLRTAVISSRRPDKLPNVENAVGFEIKAKFAGPNGNKEKGANNG